MTMVYMPWSSFNESPVRRTHARNTQALVFSISHRSCLLAEEKKKISFPQILFRRLYITFRRD